MSDDTVYYNPWAESLTKEILWFDSGDIHNPDAVVQVKQDPDNPFIWAFDPQEVQTKMDKYGEVWFHVTKGDVHK